MAYPEDCNACPESAASKGGCLTQKDKCPSWLQWVAAQNIKKAGEQQATKLRLASDVNCNFSSDHL